MNDWFEQIWAQKFAFLGTFFVVFTLSYIVLLALDWLPESSVVDTTEEAAVEAVSESEELKVVEPAEVAVAAADGVVEAAETLAQEEVAMVGAEQASPGPVFEAVAATVMPVEISIARLGKTVAVLNPTSRTIADLDAALLAGVVRHPDSAVLGQEGTVFILGHSSYLPQVFNKNFQAFNGIQDLEWGDRIEVSSVDTVYEYRVEKVYRAQAQDVTVPIAGDKKLLTLATCNSFGSIDDRYIVEAKQVAVRER